MKVRMLTTKAGPDGGWNAGDILDRDDGEQLIAEGVASEHGRVAKVERAAASPQRAADPESVTVEKPIQPAAPKPRHHGDPKDHSRRK
jgi:hypothetical protein